MECLEVTLSFTLNKNLAIISGFLIALTTWVYLEHQAMTSKFNQDMGNGVVIYADKYVESGDWVFDCNYSRLISRSPLPPPLDHLKQEARPKPTSAYSLSPLIEPLRTRLFRNLPRNRTGIQICATYSPQLARTANLVSICLIPPPNMKTASGLSICFRQSKMKSGRVSI